MSEEYIEFSEDQEKVHDIIINLWHICSLGNTEFRQVLDFISSYIESTAEL